MAVFLAGVTARELLMFGRLSESSHVIRTGLSLAGLPNAGATVRLSAALLAVRQGSLEKAALHVRRANELVVALESSPGREAPPVLAEYLLARGEAQQALDQLSRTLVAQFADPRVADEMLMWGARAAAELTESARDRRDSERERRATVAFDDLVALRESLSPPPFEVITPQDLIQPALKALFTAETARCAANVPASPVWEEAVRRCGAAGMHWEEAVASCRWARALLDEGGSRAAVGVPLRSAYRFAVEVGAIPLQRQVETLAMLSKLPLEEPAVASLEHPSGPFASLTKREHEVLSYLVAGRTYAEIASALFISEKTVSAHVSNLLHKTGTSSRREVSALALRVGQYSMGTQ
jgi:DNA-binding CsgD family transcriptional regulator